MIVEYMNWRMIKSMKQRILLIKLSSVQRAEKYLRLISPVSGWNKMSSYERERGRSASRSPPPQRSRTPPEDYSRQGRTPEREEYKPRMSRSGSGGRSGSRDGRRTPPSDSPRLKHQLLILFYSWKFIAEWDLGLQEKEEDLAAMKDPRYLILPYETHLPGYCFNFDV